MERMENPVNATKGYQFIVYRIPGHPEAELMQDGLHLRNVIIENVTVFYSGGPLWLENVYFVNCKFDFPAPAKGPVPNTPDFARAILASPSVRFERNSEENPRK